MLITDGYYEIRSDLPWIFGDFEISTETAQRVYNDVNDGAVFYESVEKTR